MLLVIVAATVVCFVIKSIGAVYVSVAIHVVVAMCGIPVVVMVLTGFVVCVSAVIIGFPWMCRCGGYKG